MSIPGLNSSAPPAQDPPAVPPQIVHPRPASPTLRNRPVQQGEGEREDASSERGLKRGPPAEGDEAGMDIEPSTQPEFKRRRVDTGPATPERLQALIDAEDEAGLRTLLQQAPELLNKSHLPPILQGMTPLCYAASKGLGVMARCLIDCNASVEVTSWGIHTPLMYACGSGDLGTAQMLVARGANLAVTDHNGANCLHYAANNNQAETVAWLLDQQMSVNEPTKLGTTPLMYACGSDHLGTAQILVARGANLAVKDTYGNNCLHYAASNNRTETVAWLLDQNLSVNEPTNFGMTPLMCACGSGHLGTAQMLVARGANLVVTDRNGDNCLHHAVKNGREVVVEFLLDHGAPVDGGDGAGVTPISSALESGRLNIVTALIYHGANLQLRVGEGEESVDDQIFRLAVQANHYGALLSLIAKNWWSAEAWDVPPTKESADDSSDEELREMVSAQSPAIYDLDRVFRGMKLQAYLAPEDQVDQVNQLLDPAWLSLEKKSDRQEFIDYYQTQFFLTDSNASNQSISETVLSSHPLFSYTIHDHLKPQQGEFSELLQALVGAGRPINTSHKKKILWFKLEALKAAHITQSFQNKNLFLTTENIICNVVTRQLDALRLAAKEYFVDEQANFSKVLTELCKKYIRIDGRFDATGFNKVLIKQGIYAVNADRLTALVSTAFEVVRRRPLDLPSMTTVGRAFDLNAPQVIESLFIELKKSLIYLARAHEIEGLELADSEEQDSYPGLSAALKKPLNDPPDASVLPGFADGLARLEQKDQDIYVEQIFGQWRQLSAALGVALPELGASQQ